MKKKNLLKFIMIDYIAYLTTVMFFVLTGFVTYFAYVGEELYLIIIFGIGIILGLVFTIKRILSINSILDSDNEVEGVITKVWFYRDRGNIQYTYTFEGVDYKCNHRVMKSRVTKIYRIGNEVTLKVSNKNPKQALIKELFFEY